MDFVGMTNWRRTSLSVSSDESSFEASSDSAPSCERGPYEMQQPFRRGVACLAWAAAMC